jgi:hypothetical protein
MEAWTVKHFASSGSVYHSLSANSTAIVRRLTAVDRRPVAILEDHMFRVDAENLQSYFDFDPKRRADLQKLDKFIGESAPGLKRYFHRGTPAGQPGMRFKMIGYGRFQYLARFGKSVDWPVIGVALQKNYISVYLSVAKNGVPLVRSYSGKLGELRSGGNNFSFERYEELVTPVVASLFAEAEKIFSASIADRTLPGSVLVPRRNARKK